MEQLKDRPPFVSFEVRPVEDRTASLDRGYFVSTDVDFAVITPPGSKDRIERKVDEWFEHLEQESRSNRFPADWLRQLRAGYTEWKAGRELPIDGTPIANWSVASPAQTKNLLSIGVRSVEDLAVANEEVISRLGMGGRALKQRAVDWVQSQKGSGKLSGEMEALRASNEALKTRNETLEKQIADFNARLASLEKPAAKASKF